jgi:hypothetical protein
LQRICYSAQQQGNRYKLTSGCSRNAKGGDTAHNTKDILLAYCDNIPLGSVCALDDSVEENVFAACLKDLLIGCFESWDRIAGDGVGWRGRGFQREGIECLGHLCVGHGGRRWLRLARTVRLRSPASMFPINELKMAES